MRYNLGYMDKYPIEAVGSSVENNPMYRVVFKRPIDPIRLEAAVYKAMEVYPLFKTMVKFDGQYYLETNDKPIIILNVKEDERPKKFGKDTNGYPFRVAYYDRQLCFEFLHGVTDGSGSSTFLKDIILAYFDNDTVKKTPSFLVAPGLEPFFNKKEKGVNYVPEPQGFSVKDFPRRKEIFSVECRSLVCDSKEIVNLAHICNSSVAPVLAILYSRSLRKHLPEKAKNKNVACNIAIDIRKTLNYETMHNCIDLRRFTYIDEYEKMNFKSVAEIYKQKLDNARLAPNIVRGVTDRVKVFKSYHFLPFKWFHKLIVKLYGKIFKDTDCNFVVTYLGKWDLPADIMDKIENIDVKLIPDLGQCVMIALDFDGRFNLNIHDNYVDRGVVDDFIKMSASLGVHWKDLGGHMYTQSHFVEK